ncbi:5-formyltetrahydrofolate cyclo-ligase [Desulfohalobium retbaense]|uniref:5-formyltetrahydrofolate cyclo-ligase n=1 Tax=Desulfohalobium retbaense (strain ATCC 49708 / DSM 5692 / JCM 16813 / HR100) TaxID=485915 RepID=C8X227_DESRD|nr:5-formyltetrahydrofolate cyclo-ligase [Desulfohalobium retbaense]ACV68350.1 5-formyltetrahydrofolate cyclo-ligase [Desulfohalobium retbaense DSM 5692]
MPSTPLQQDDKSRLRRALMRQRRDLAPDEVVSASRCIQDHVFALPQWQRSETFLLYAPIHNEVDTWPLIEAAWKSERSVLLPRCRQCERGEMDLACVRTVDELQPGFQNIPEPKEHLCRPPGLFPIDVAFVPCVGVDRSGVRLGYGGGYYDRFLSRARRTGMLIVALAYAFQVVPALPSEPWDIPVDCIVTEAGSFWTPQH